MKPHRRDFLRLTGFAGLSLGLPSGLGAVLCPSERRGDRNVLVLVELTGGNDGLNTIVPFGDDRYHRARPTLRIAPSAVHRIDEVLGFAPPLKKLSTLFASGELAVVQGVGMKNPDRSHFTSLDRWHLGRLDETRGGESWLAQGLDSIEGAAPAFAGIALGERVMPRVFQHRALQSLCCDDLSDLVPPDDARSVLLSKALRGFDAGAGSPDDQRLAEASRELLRTLEDVLRQPVAAHAFPNTHAGRLLSDASRLVASGLDVPAIFIRQGGFDTHARQADVQPALLADVDGAVGAFAADMKARGLERRVLVIVYSEFGRRVAENGSRGTDHGSGAPVLVWGGGTAGRLVGDRPDLASLDDGDVRATTDFRRVLAQGLKHLGHPRPAAILGDGIEPLF